jgi:hypothetical protein
MNVQEFWYLVQRRIDVNHRYEMGGVAAAVNWKTEERFRIFLVRVYCPVATVVKN